MTRYLDLTERTGPLVMDDYCAALIFGRAFALANGEPAVQHDPVAELRTLCGGDELVLLLVQERFRGLLALRPSADDQRAFDLLEAALGDAQGVDDQQGGVPQFDVAPHHVRA